MSITAELRASARATYRALFRTAAVTFRGDDRVLDAFREKVRKEYREGRSQTDPTAYAARIHLGREVADVLRKNVVQGVRVRGASASVEKESSSSKDERDIYRLRLTEHTELGSNDSIKPMRSSPSSCQSRKVEKRQLHTSTSALRDDRKSSATKESNTTSIEYDSENHGSTTKDPFLRDQEGEMSQKVRRLNYSALKKATKARVIPELKEEDLEESFVRGSGPGGQSINKTRNNVQLLHKPTKLRVACQETRSLDDNRRIARKRLLDKLDELTNPGISRLDLKHAQEIEQARRRRKKKKQKQAKA